MKTKLFVAIGLALIAVTSLWLYSQSLEREVAGGQKVAVLVAGQDVPAGTRITKAMLAVREVPEAYVYEGYIRKGEENQIIGRPVADKVSAGQYLLWSSFELQKAATSRRLSGAVQKGQRALTIPVDTSGSLAGMLRPGDRVDVLGTFARNQGTDWATVTLLQNVLVLATGDLRGGSDGDEPSGNHTFSNITVSVDPEETELLVFAMQRGPLNIALRAQDDMTTIEDIPDKTFADIFEGQKRAAFARKRAQKRIEVLRPQ